VSNYLFLRYYSSNALKIAQTNELCRQFQIHHMKRFFVLALYLLSCHWLLAQNTANWRADKTSIVIGDPFRLHLEANNSTSPLTNIQYKIDSLSGFEVLYDSLSANKTLVLTVFDSGYYELPPLVLHYQDGNGSKDSIITGAIGVSVRYPTSALSDTAQIAPIRPVIEEPMQWEDIAIYVYITLGILVIIFAIYAYMRWRNRPQPEAPLPPPPPLPHEIALAKLAILRANSPWLSGDLKTYYSELTYIVREYIENRYNINALESTTEEMTTALRQTDFPQNLNQDLHNVLQTADLVKFARSEPDSDFHINALDQAESFVKLTIVENPEADVSKKP